MIFEAQMPLKGCIAFSIDGQPVGADEFFSELEYAKANYEVMSREATYSRFYMKFAK